MGDEASPQSSVDPVSQPLGPVPGVWEGFSFWEPGPLCGHFGDPRNCFWEARGSNSAVPLLKLRLTCMSSLSPLSKHGDGAESSELLTMVTSPKTGVCQESPLRAEDVVFSHHLGNSKEFGSYVSELGSKTSMYTYFLLFHSPLNPIILS